MVLFCGHPDELDKFLEVKNQEAKNDSFPYNFTVCFSTMYEFNNVLQVTSHNTDYELTDLAFLFIGFNYL